MAATFLQRFYKRPLFTADEVGKIIEAILGNTYDKKDVVEAFEQADDFNAGAVDKPLNKHIFAALNRLGKTDTLKNSERVKAWKNFLME